MSGVWVLFLGFSVHQWGFVWCLCGVSKASVGYLSGQANDNGDEVLPKMDMCMNMNMNMTLSMTRRSCLACPFHVDDTPPHNVDIAERVATTPTREIAVFVPR